MEGIERIKKLSDEIKDANIKKVAEYLINREDMDEKYLNDEKNLIEMWEFIKGQAKEQAENGCAVLEDEKVYGLAIHYFDESNEALGISKKEQKTTKKENTKATDNKPKQSKDKAEEQHKDDDIVMKYKGKPVTYKEFKDGSYLQLS